MRNARPWAITRGKHPSLAPGGYTLCGGQLRVIGDITDPGSSDTPHRSWSPVVWGVRKLVEMSRENGQVVNRALVIAVGVNDSGRREVLGLSVGPSETESFWTDFLRSLVKRGLSGVRLVMRVHGGY